LFCSILGCLLFLICTEFVYLYFPVLFCLSVSVKWLAVKTASEMTYTVSSGALNSTPTNQRSAPSNRTDCLTDWYADGRRAQSVMSRSCCICRHGHTVRAGGVDDTHTHTHTHRQTDLTDTYSTPGQLSLASLPPGSLYRVPALAGVKAGCCHCRVAGNTVSVSKAHNSHNA